LISDVSPSDAQKYIDAHGRWSDVSKNTHIRHLRALYAFHIKAGHASLNPFKSVELVQIDEDGDVRPKVIPVEDVKALLQFALDNEYHAECASMVLVFFCGVRVEEVERLDWNDIRLEGSAPIVDLRKTKKRRRRINEIPENAVCWLKLCASTGKVAPNNYIKQMQRFRSKAGIAYPQNAARHCFASYHLQCFGDATKTAILLAHRNPSLLYQTYREVVATEDAARYFEILPKSVEEERKLAKERKLIELDQAEKEWVEAESNCGRAERGEDGRWAAVIDEELTRPCDWDEALQESPILRLG
jgi:integrase/recombinase XerD